MIREHKLVILLPGVMGCARLSEELFLAGAFRVGRHEHPPPFALPGLHAVSEQPPPGWAITAGPRAGHEGPLR